MHDADAIEAINFEQLATATDRLLLRGERISKRRPSMHRMTYIARPIENEERTFVVRRPAQHASGSIAPAALLVSALCFCAASIVTLV